ncbi:MAG: mechanosensitive ion channel [Deltaproteobacteria bacterium]|nr:mechanosensitive ion channel [Deltaproteobacteria bacterium]
MPGDGHGGHLFGIANESGRFDSAAAEDRTGDAMIGNRGPYILKKLITLGMAVILCLAAAPIGSFGQAPTTPPKPANPPATVAISPAEVAGKATEATNLVMTLSTEFVSGAEIEKIREPFFQMSRQIEGEYASVSITLEETPSLEKLQALDGVWKDRRDQINAWLDLLTQRSVALQKVLDQLSSLKTTWTETRKTARAAQAPAETLQQIQAVLNAIEAVQAPLGATHDRVLGLQGVISETLKRCDDILSRIVQAQKGVVAGILTQELPPIWDTGQWHAARTAIPVRVHEIATALRSDLNHFFTDPSREMPLQVILFAVLIALFSAARRFVHRWTGDDEKMAHLAQVFARPYAAALFTVWLFATRYASPIPPMVRELITALALIPVLRLIQPAIAPRTIPALYVLGALYAVDTLRGFFAGAAVVDPLLLMVEALAAMAVLGWLLTSGGLLHASAKNTAAARRAMVVFVKVAMVYLAVGAAAGALGFLGLARLITPGSLTACVLAVAFFAGVRVFGGVVTVILRLWPLRRLRMVQTHGDLLAKWAYRLLVWLAVLGWAIRLLNQLGLLDPIQTIGEALLAMTFARGAISISIGDILAFVVTVGASFLLSRFIRFTLNEEVYPRAHIPSGAAYAASRLLHYTILTLGFLVGLGVLGVNLTKISVLAGAFGVGIGFGLQNVVNNFVCGLIMLFERPVHVGDTVELDGIMGEVRLIGFRASSVRTWQGADIIIPNAQFITAKVTNWTFRDRLRRVDLPVSVAYASDPKQVIELLEGVARAHPQILAYPAPLCIFTSYGDSAINFELRVWINLAADLTNVPQIRSDLNAAVYDAVMAAGMSFPFPQREVRLLGDPESRASASEPAEDFAASGETRDETEKNR